MEDQTRSLSEVAGLMGVSERTVRRWIKAGRLKAYKPGRDYRIPETGLRTFIEESEISPKALPLVLPIDVDALETEILKTARPESREELYDAIREAGAREVLARYQPEDLYELRKTLREERQRIHQQPRTRADIEREDPLPVLIDLLWNIEAVERALESALGHQLAGTPEEEID